MPTTKKVDFDSIYIAFAEVIKNIDIEIDRIKKEVPVEHHKQPWSFYNKTQKEFCLDIEEKAIKIVSELLKMTEKAVKEKWLVCSLPTPVYSALEENKIPYSKAKLLVKFHFDPWNDKDIAIVDNIVNKIIEGVSDDEIKKLLEESQKTVWNPSHTTIQRLIEQSMISKVETPVQGVVV
jgi:hypothetical protein